MEALTPQSTAKLVRNAVISGSASSDGCPTDVQLEEPSDPPQVRLLAAAAEMPRADGPTRLFYQPGDRSAIENLPGLAWPAPLASGQTLSCCARSVGCGAE